MKKQIKHYTTKSYKATDEKYATTRIIWDDMNIGYWCKIGGQYHLFIDCDAKEYELVFKSLYFLHKWLKNAYGNPKDFL